MPLFSYRTLPAWDENVMVNAFNAAKVPVTEETRSAFESLCDTFDDAIGDNYYVSDICVDENYRNRGYGKCMLNNIIRVAEKQTGVNVVLSVYENNISAMSLYNLMGSFLMCPPTTTEARAITIRKNTSR